MSNLKTLTIDLIRKLPDNCTLEDIQYELYFKAKVEKGLTDIKKKRVLTEDDMDKEIKSWHM
jgi:hypothetical protein